jgi:alkyl hydroperoxide reductase subunit AhpF
MALISPADQARLREDFAKMTRPVRLLFFTQTLDCETCLQARQVIDELPAVSDRITVEEVNFVLDGDRAKRFGIDRVPAIAVTTTDEAGGEVDSRIRFLGTPAGYEFIALIRAVLLAGGAREPDLSDAGRARLAEIDKPLTLQVFTTPT